LLRGTLIIGIPARDRIGGGLSAVLAARQQVVPVIAPNRTAATYHKPLKFWQFFEIPGMAHGLHRL
jgi:hypothetical protein